MQLLFRPLKIWLAGQMPFLEELQMNLMERYGENYIDQILLLSCQREDNSGWS